jgi:hypothetical protein
MTTSIAQYRPAEHRPRCKYSHLMCEFCQQCRCTDRNAGTGYPADLVNVRSGQYGNVCRECNEELRLENG